MTAVSDDPRAQRTRASLVDALCGLMRCGAFERISVAEIAEAAGVNRATFYAHFPDKFALLDALVTTRFDAMLESRGVVFGGCASALRATILAVCDYLAAQSWTDAGARPSLPPPHLEAATIAVVRRRLLAGMRQQETGARGDCGRARLIAGTAAWAIWGAAREWFEHPRRVVPTEIVGVIEALVAPILATARWRETTPA